MLTSNPGHVARAEHRMALTPTGRGTAIDFSESSLMRHTQKNGPGRNGHDRSAANRTGRHARRSETRVRFAVVGAGHIAQNAILPAFANARRDCELVALVSGDARKRAELARQYKIKYLVDYENFERACRAGI